MTPSDDDLRTSLHHGEGDPVDVERIVTAGESARAHRRARRTGVAAALVFAAGVAITGVVLSRDTTGSTSAASGTARSPQAQPAYSRAVAPGEPAPGASSVPTTDAPTATGAPAPAACPDTFPQRALPGAARAGALFDRPAASITVCGYGSSVSTPNPASLRYSGTRATELQRSLENAPIRTTNTSCATVQGTAERYLAFVAVDSSGRTMRVVTTTLTVPICDTRTTNGVTVRYGWVPPLGVRQQLYALTPDGLPSVPPNRVPSGKNIGTPVR